MDVTPLGSGSRCDSTGVTGEYGGRSGVPGRSARLSSGATGEKLALCSKGADMAAGPWCFEDVGRNNMFHRWRLPG